MKKLIIYWHPNQKSYCSAIVESYKDGSESAWHEVEIIDIYREHKQSFLEFANNPNTETTKIIQEKISSADELCFVFPMRRFDVPAIVKNFYDINMNRWFAYKTENGKNIWLLTGKSWRIITTAGANSWFIKMLYKFVFYLVRWQWRIAFLWMNYLGTSINMDTMNPKKEDQRKSFLTYIYSLGMK